MKYVKPIVSWAIALWASFIFLSSLPYKFSKHPDTEHIFGTIGQWMSDTLNKELGEIFSNIGAYVVGSVELITSIILLLPAILWVLTKIGMRKSGALRERFHAIGGFLASSVMTGAVFFHLFTPLGVEVIHQGESDGGSLFYAAVSILVLGVVLFILNVGGLSKNRK